MYSESELMGLSCSQIAVNGEDNCDKLCWRVGSVSVVNTNNSKIHPAFKRSVLSRQ